MIGHSEEPVSFSHTLGLPCLAPAILRDVATPSLPTVQLWQSNGLGTGHRI